MILRMGLGDISDNKFSDTELSETDFPTPNFPTQIFRLKFSDSNLPTNKFADKQIFR